MSISSLVIHADPERINELHTCLEAFVGVEVHGISDDGKMVVTVDVANDRKAADTLMEIQKQDGVLSASLIYNHFEKSAEQSLGAKEHVR